MIKAAMQHAWGNYAKYAFGHDELMPRSRKGKDPFGGMKEEYQQARDWVATELNFTK